MDINKLACNAGFDGNQRNTLRVKLERFAALVAEAERNECLKAIDEADNCECGVPCDCFGAGTAKWAIKARSNADVTGLAPRKDSK